MVEASFHFIEFWLRLRIQVKFSLHGDQRQRYTLSKNPCPKYQALVILRGDLLCWMFIDLLKFQISNPKYQINPKLQNSIPKHITESNESNRSGCPWNATFGLSSAWIKLLVPSQNLFPPFCKGGQGDFFWSFEFGYCPSTGSGWWACRTICHLFFWCLDFFIFKGPTIVRYSVRLY